MIELAIGIIAAVVIFYAGITCLALLFLLGPYLLMLIGVAGLAINTDTLVAEAAPGQDAV